MSEQSAPLSRRQLQFLVTENCNLNCVYCYEEHKTGRSLPASFMCEKIRQEMETGSQGDLLVDFFGGEPLLRFDAIREVVDWFHAQHWPRTRRVWFSVGTNGTLLNDTRKQWFARNCNDVILCLSLDGTPSAHDRNRSNSYNAIAPHLSFFREYWPQQPVKMTIGPQTVDQVYEGLLHLHSLGFEVDADVVFEDVWGDEVSLASAVEIFSQELAKLVEYYAAHPGVPRPKLVKRPLVELFNSKWTRDLTFCGAGTHLICYTASGEEYPCMRFSPVATCKPLRRLGDSPQAEGVPCSRCVFEPICPSCQGYNYTVNGSHINRTAYHCRFFQASLLASARLMLLEEPELLAPPSHDSKRPEQIERMQKLLAIRAVSEWCNLKGNPENMTTPTTCGFNRESNCRCSNADCLGEGVHPKVEVG